MTGVQTCALPICFPVTINGEFTRETMERIGEVYYINTHGDILKEVEITNEKIDKSKERERDDMVHELAKDMKKAILKEF